MRENAAFLWSVAELAQNGGNLPEVMPRGCSPSFLHAPLPVILGERGEMMHLRIIVAAAAVLVPGLAAAEVPLPAMGQAPLSGLYIGAGIGLNWLQNEHLINGIGTAAPGSISSHLGMVGVASVGYALPMGLRFELEGDLRNNPISGAHDLGFTASAGGRERKYGPMFNVLYDLSPWIPPGYFSPRRRRLPMGTIVRVSCQRVPDRLSQHHHRWHQGGNRLSVHSRWRDADPTSARLGFDR